MAGQGRAPGHGLDLFWEQADIDGSDEEPLVRELRHRLDAIARYGRMIADVEAMGRESMADTLRERCAEEEALAHDLRRALRERRRADGREQAP
jgi:hypothetical protein